MKSFEFSLNVFIQFTKFSDNKIFVITVKGFEPSTSCVKDRYATTAPGILVRERIFKLTVHASVI